MQLLILIVLVLLALAFSELNHENFSSRRRRSKELEEKLNKLDAATKSRIHAMKASGMPKEAIAEKIAYVAGDKNTARRIVDALHEDKVKVAPKKPTPNANAGAKFTSTAKAPTAPKFSQPNSMPINVNSKAKAQTKNQQTKRK